MDDGLVYGGIDEAGYGPRLGPLCVGLSVFRIREWHEGDPAPDLWKLIAPAVARTSKDKLGRIPIADSKVLKLSNQLKRSHPLRHLERGVLAMGGASSEIASSDADLFDALGVGLEPHDWYETEQTPLPLACDLGALRLDVGMLGRAMASAGVELLAMRCIVVGEASFNAELRENHSKAEIVCGAVRDHLERVAAIAAGKPARVICDRLSGRMRYGDLVSDATGVDIRTLEESPRCSRYAAGDFGVQFVPEGESKHLPVALASMVAKLVRELAMIRFNRYWLTRNPDIKPTAGYWQDANRWLSDMDSELRDSERQTLIRMA